jgi:hypothetical protein
MSLLRLIRQQLGLSDTPANNFHWDASADDGSLSLLRGDSGSPTQTILTIDAAGVVMFPPAPPQTGPALRAALGSNQTIATSTYTEINLTETIDTDGRFQSNRFTPNVPGYYHVVGCIDFGANTTVAQNQALLYKNGSAAVTARAWGHVSTPHGVTVSDLIYMNGSTDYVTLVAYQNTGANVLANATYTRLHAHLARRA